ncbi:uncharacterized protein LOC114258058 [Camellia sinensis]|uniref:uncharacterized protein LOC114258058 n=1 Tax=Camellia sinensis TaxID=4442 RepID=UPI00103664C7|nr:uncharacterized protein LOC114258058 [Camellia sinensis]
MSNIVEHQASPNTAKSTEEEDHLIRSTKKIKSSDTSAPSEMDTEVIMATIIGEEDPRSQSLPSQASPPAKSFKEALSTARNYDYTFDSRVEVLSSDEEDDEQEGRTSIEHSTSDHIGIPKVSLPNKLLQKIRKPWASSLIIRLLGKSIGYKMLCTRVKNLWGLQEEFSAIDLGCNYFLFKFSNPEDFTKVHTGGPWVIMDHYLTVRLWEPNFKPSEALETTTAIWVRFPELPIEYYHDKVLFAIAKTIGKPLKIDWTTAMVTRGKFARICVEMDLTKPLIPKFVLEDKCYSIEYESLHSFCFLCGRIDHRREACRFKTHIAQPTGEKLAVTSDDSHGTSTTDANGNLQPQEVREDEFGPWMLVTKRGRRPIQPRKIQVPSGPTTKPNKFSPLDEGQKGQEDHPRGRKHNRAGAEKAPNN